jgi:hypothetical protein
MATLDDIPSLPSSIGLSLDDLVAVYDLADRRSPKKASLSEIASLLVQEAGIVTEGDIDALDARIDALEAGSEATLLETNADKLAYSPTLGELVEITDEAGRIERYIGGDAISGFFLTNVGSDDYPLAVINQPTDSTKAYFGQPAPYDYWYADWDVNTPDEWSLTNSDDNVIWSSDEDVDSPLDVVTWTKVFEEPDEEAPIYPETPTLVEAPAANQDNWEVLRNTVALYINWAEGAGATTINGIAFDGESSETGVFVGWVDPLEIPLAAPDTSPFVCTVIEMGAVAAGGFFVNVSSDQYINLPTVTPNRGIVTLTFE